MSIIDDLDAMSPEELAAEAKELTGIDFKVQPPVVEQPRDESGKFVAKPKEGTTEEPNEHPVEEEPEPQVFVHTEEYDPGVGGTQKFTGTGASPAEAVADCLAQIKKAHIHATQKIHSQDRELKERASRLTEDEKFVIQKQMQSEPEKAIALVVEKEFGMTPAEARAMKAKIDAQDKAAMDERVKRQWVQEHSEYFEKYANKENAQRMERWLSSQANGVVSVENLNAAYADLKESGLLKEKAVTPPAEPTVALPKPVRRASGLSQSASAPKPVAPKAATQEEVQAAVDKMSDAEFNQLVRDQRGW